MTRPDKPGVLEIAALGEVDDGLLRWLVQELQRTLSRECRQVYAQPLPPEWADASTGRVAADAALSGLIKRFFRVHEPQTGRWLLAITSADLAAVNGDDVFGEATVGGCCALVSTAHLRPSTHPRGDDLALLRLRLLKESVHELGHLAGLTHCTDLDCVMSASATLAAVDRKSSEFCSRCRREPGCDRLRT